ITGGGIARSPVTSAEAFLLRAARAESLAGSSAAARDPLLFAAGLYRVQAELAEKFHGTELELDRIVEASPLLLNYAAERGPQMLAAEAKKATETPALL